MNLNKPSANRVAANRANAQKSTGPRTPEGKARASRNALQHGFAATSFTAVRLEDLDDLANLKADLINDYRPQNSQELFALERIALAQLSLLRVARLEAGLFTTAFNSGVDRAGEQLTLHHADVIGGLEVTRAQNRHYALAEGFHKMTQRPHSSWALFLRYQSQAERQYRRAVEEFDRLKSQREEFPNEPIAEPQPAEPKEEPSTAPQLLTLYERDDQGQVISITESLVDPQEIQNLPPTLF